jgi:thiamine-phosphate pyrophosphorylase
LVSVDLSRCWLYGILDLGYVARGDAARVVSEMIDGGVDLIQLRAKAVELQEITALAAHLHPLTSAANIPLVINDHAEVAREVPIEGVHVGQDDRSIATVRQIAGADCFVGKSTHSLEQARRAAAEGADYIGWGPLFATPTKPDYVPIGLQQIEAVHAAVELPIFCIGGVKLETLPHLLAAGARRVVIVSGLLQAPDIAQYARAVRALLTRSDAAPGRASF